MSISLLFWVLYIVGVLFSGWAVWPFTRASAPTLWVLVLIALLGYAQFGAAVHR
jgi:hypothetical protein